MTAVLSIPREQLKIQNVLSKKAIAKLKWNPKKYPIQKKSEGIGDFKENN